MPNNAEIRASIHNVLLGSGLTAAEISQRLRNHYRITVSAREVSNHLSRAPQSFRFEGTNPQYWFARELTQGQVTGQRDLPARRASCRDVPIRAFRVAPLAHELYQWQERAISSWKAARGRGVVEAVTGTGKTMVATFIISKYIAAGKRCLVVVPSIVLLEQWKVKLEENLKIAITSTVGGDSGRSIDFGCPVTIGVVNTIANMADELDGCFDLIVGDECHRYGARVFQKALLPSVRHRLGLTATLERSDEGVETVLIPYFGGICFKYGYREASDEDVIAKYSVIGFPVELEPAELRRYQRSGEEMNDARTQLIQRHRYPSDSEFLQRVANAASGSGADAGLARFFMASMTSRRRVLSETQVKLEICSLLAPAIHSASRTLIFCETVSASKAICDKLRAKEVLVSEYHSGLGVNQRAEILKKFTHGDLQCVVAVHALDEGVDVPDIDFGVILAGTSQRRQMIQRMGRVLRRKDDGRNACFAVVFAKGTSEDPDMNDRADGYLSTVIEFADRYLKVDKIDIVSNTVGFEREKCREFADVDDTDPLDHVWFELDALVDYFIRGDMPSFGDTIEEEIPF